MQALNFEQQRPILCVVVDAEEEFSWDRPVSSSANSTASIRSQRRAHDVFSQYGVRPTYLVTYPVATDPEAADVLGGYRAAGQCDIGAQLHPWVTPPHFPSTDERSTFPGNLPEAIEKQKIEELSRAIETAFGLQPTVYKAGRYGFGPRTARLIEEAGYLVDTSLIPRSSYAGVGGPDLSRFDYKPFWFGERRQLLELPVTRALIGLLATRAPSLYRAADSKQMRSLHAGGLLSRSGLLERVTLSPEGSDLDAMCRLTQALLARGERIFTLSYHSPSLEPGNTPYVSTPRDLAVFLDRLSGFLHFFQNTLGGEFLTVQEVRGRLLGETSVAKSAEAPTKPVSIVTKPEGEPAKRCLVVANTFPPVHGGSAVVYDSLARFGRGRVSVLAPQDDYRTGGPIGLWRESDTARPFTVHRIRRLRTALLPDNAGIFARLTTLMDEIAIRASILRAIVRIVRAENIGTICIGELVACGWLAHIRHILPKVKVVIYVHGEEITTRTPYDLDGRRRRRTLAAADGCVAVSRFTREGLIESFGVSPFKIELISNGVDLGRFRKRARRADLALRHGLDGKRVLLTVGRLYARKGVDRVIQSLPRVLQAIPDLHYVVVGDGPYLPVLEDLARELGISDRISFAGAVSDTDLVDYYGIADAFIMANREMPDGDTEGFGLVFLEANACGLPVVAGKAGGSVDAVTHDLNGLLVDGEDPASIAAAIESLFLDDARRARLIAGGTEVANRSGWEQRVDQFLAFCDRTTAPS